MQLHFAFTSTRTLGFLLLVAATAATAEAVASAAEQPAANSVVTMRVPDGGIQPQAVVDPTGVIHLIYLQGDPAKSDIDYIRSNDGGKIWSDPLRVNSQPGSAIAMGTIRGAHLALGKEGRVHVAWMGSRDAEPKAPGAATPMLYSRLADDGKSFEPQRNVISEKVGLDGGGSIAADGRGNVYVAWHAPEKPGAGEAGRRVWMARSSDEGKTFAPEIALSPDATGACGCCGMRVFAVDGRLFALYRSATNSIHRDMYLLDVADPVGDSKEIISTKVAPMESGQCIMSTTSISGGPGKIAAAWETAGRIEFGRIDAKSGKIDQRRVVPGESTRRKHPAIATNSKGETLLAWAEGTGWNKGGAVVWQLFDAEGKPVSASAGKQSGLPAWSLPAVVATGDGSFVVLY
jgi:hypothetical protein